MEECNLRIEVEDIEEIEEVEIRSIFKLMLKRLIKFRKKERELLGEIPPVLCDRLCRKAFETMRELQKKGLEKGIKLQLRL